MTVSIEHRIAAEDLLTAFCYRVDNGQADTVHELFIPSGRVETPAFTCEDRDAIQRHFTARANDGSRVTRHFWTNMTISGDAERMTVTSNAMTVITTGGETMIVGGGGHDTIVRDGDRWAFSSRKLTIAFQGRLSPMEPRQ